MEKAVGVKLRHRYVLLNLPEITRIHGHSGNSYLILETMRPCPVYHQFIVSNLPISLLAIRSRRFTLHVPAFLPIVLYFSRVTGSDKDSKKRDETSISHPPVSPHGMGAKEGSCQRAICHWAYHFPKGRQRPMQMMKFHCSQIYCFPPPDMPWTGSVRELCPRATRTNPPSVLQEGAVSNGTAA